MILIRVELHSARTGQITEIGRMKLSRTAPITNERRGNYFGRVFRKPGFTDVTRSGEVINHPRLDEPVWSLIAKMLIAMGYGPKSKATKPTPVPPGDPRVAKTPKSRQFA